MHLEGRHIWGTHIWGKHTSGGDKLLEGMLIWRYRSGRDIHLKETHSKSTSGGDAHLEGTGIWRGPILRRPLSLPFSPTLRTAAAAVRPPPPPTHTPNPCHPLEQGPGAPCVSHPSTENDLAQSFLAAGGWQSPDLDRFTAGNQAPPTPAETTCAHRPGRPPHYKAEGELHLLQDLLPLPCSLSTSPLLPATLTPSSTVLTHRAPLSRTTNLHHLP